MDRFVRLPNLGLCSIAANADRNLSEIKVLDLIAAGRFPRTYFTKVIKKYRPDIIGFSSMIFQYKETLFLAQTARKILPGVKIILGGYCSTIDYDNIFLNDESGCIDYLIRGEGELAFNKLLKAISGKLSFENVNNLSYRNNGNTVHNPSDKLLNLDDIRFPDRNSRIIKKGFFMFGYPMDVIETSRGCTFDCNFCSINMMYGKVYREYSINRVIEDIRNVEKLGAKSVMMIDDNITLNGKRYYQLCEAIIESNLNHIKVLIQASVAGLKRTPGLIKIMAKSGVKWVYLGIENAVSEALDYMNKGKQFTNIDTEDVVRELRENGITVLGGFILGYPDDNEHTLRQNLEFAKKLKVDIALFNVITPYPKTRIRDELIELDMITNKDDYTKYDCWEVNVRTKHLSPDDIYRIRYDMESRYHFESGVVYGLFRRFPLFMTKMAIDWFTRKPSDVYKFLRGLILSFKK